MERQPSNFNQAKDGYDADCLDAAGTERSNASQRLGATTGHAARQWAGQPEFVV